MDLQIENISVIRERRQILKDISFTVGRHEFVGILGPSGSGKSTLIEILSLTGVPSSGRVLFDGNQDIVNAAEEYKKLLRYVPQHNTLYPMLTVRENIWYAARLLLPNSSVQEVSDHVNLSLRRVGLKEHQDKQVFKLSGGQQKRAGIAAVLPGNPRLLILDEPSSGLDPAMERKLMLLLKRIAESGTTVICSTHVMENIRLFDKAVVIDKIKLVGQEAECGKLLDFLPTEQLLQKMDENNEDYAAFFEKLEADPDIYYWNAKPETSESNNLIRFFFGGVGEVLYPLRHILSLFFIFLSCFLFRVLCCLLDCVLLVRFPFVRQTFDVFERHWRLFGRDRFLLISTLCLPFILGFLIVLSQQNESNIYPLLFFALIISIWFGMNNSVRGVVSERQWFIREHLSGLNTNCFLLGKALFYFLLGFIQIGFLWQTLRWSCSFFCLETLNEKMFLLDGLLLPFVLFSCYVGGVGLGLFISSLVSTESVAISLVPLFMMPQILLSTVAAGNSVDSFDLPERIRPIMIAKTNTTADEESFLPGWEDKPATEIFRWASFFCYSRPALFLLELKVREHPDQTVRNGEQIHLLCLVVGTWTLFWLTFRFRRKQWQTQRYG
ncbi:MAG: ATP-binding cassette domain-containing protein [Planctomycetaceae bacterium]|jgi:ABC-type multidrug transport system ATPase subunit|nr:ATP-binding cassette domain-containing protein [Planctomycetaceae bacterium]